MWMIKFFLFLDPKRNRVTDEEKTILLQWLDKNKSFPYPSQSDLIDLSIKTKLEKAAIQKWIYNKRARSEKNDETKPYKVFSKSDKTILENYFKKSQNPGPLEIERLTLILKRDSKKIKKWFNNKRNRN
jgi:hypothetical protein